MPHFVFTNPAVVAVEKKVIERITQYHQAGGADFGALGMMKWLKDNLTSEEIDLIAFVEQEAGELESTQWLLKALERRPSLPYVVAEA